SLRLRAAARRRCDARVPLPLAVNERSGMPAIFLSSWCRNPQGLHSFPTRRSSDLLRLRRGDPDLSRRVAEPEPMVAGRGGRRDRSEEHTSELQSRSDLVCRLLLEKKKEPRAQLLQIDIADAERDLRASRTDVELRP